MTCYFFSGCIIHYNVSFTLVSLINGNERFIIFEIRSVSRNRELRLTNLFEGQPKQQLLFSR